MELENARMKRQLNYLAQMAEENDEVEQILKISIKNRISGKELLSPSNGNVSHNLFSVSAIGPIRLLGFISL